MRYDFEEVLRFTYAFAVHLLVGLVFLQSQDNNDILSYWLSNTSMLLFLLQRTLKASGTGGFSQQRRRTPSSTLFGRMAQVKMSQKPSYTDLWTRRNYRYRNWPHANKMYVTWVY